MGFFRNLLRLFETTETKKFIIFCTIGLMFWIVAVFTFLGLRHYFHSMNYSEYRAKISLDNDRQVEKERRQEEKERIKQEKYDKTPKGQAEIADSQKAQAEVINKELEAEHALSEPIDRGTITLPHGVSAHLTTVWRNNHLLYKVEAKHLPRKYYPQPKFYEIALVDRNDFILFTIQPVINGFVQFPNEHAIDEKGNKFSYSSENSESDTNYVDCSKEIYKSISSWKLTMYPNAP